MKSKIEITDQNKKIIVEVSRVLLGCVFVFSGFVKAVDPLGSTYKITDYLEAFGLGFLSFSALPASFFLSALEFALGVCLLLGVYRKFHSILILLFMLFMTPLTFYLAIANPVSDCGCFGDALLISNWQTFFKNLVLLAAAVIVFLWHKKITSLFTYKSFSLVVLWTWLFILSVSFYCYTFLPVLDFRPYKIGNNIPELMEIPEDAEHDVYESILIYSKDGVEQEFSIENYPKDDETWTFVDSKSRLIKKGYEPPVHDFVAINDEGDDITDALLYEPAYTFLLVSYRLDKANDSNVDKINEIYDYAKANDYPFYAITSSLPDMIQEWKENTGAEYPFCSMDEITLKTIVRSNPGLLLLKEGTIINKWPHTKLPEENRLNQRLEDSELGQIPPDRSVRRVLSLAIILFFPLIALGLFDFFHYRRKEQKDEEPEQKTKNEDK